MLVSNGVFSPSGENRGCTGEVMDGSENEFINFPVRNCEKQQGDIQVLTCVSVWCAPDITCVYAHTHL